MKQPERDILLTTKQQYMKEFTFVYNIILKPLQREVLLNNQG